MNKLFVGLFAFLSCASYAQTTAWKLSDIPGADKNVVGHIYHTYAVGTEIPAGQTPIKVVSGLRLACASKNYIVQGGSDPIVAIYWHQIPSAKPAPIDVFIDGKKQETTTWTHDGNLLFRRWVDSRSLVENMKIGKSISFTWEENSVKRTVIFDLKTFSQNFAEFSRLCNVV